MQPSEYEAVVQKRIKYTGSRIKKNLATLERFRGPRQRQWRKLRVTVTNGIWDIKRMLRQATQGNLDVNTRYYERCIQRWQERLSHLPRRPGPRCKPLHFGRGLNASRATAMGGGDEGRKINAHLRRWEGLMAEKKLMAQPSPLLKAKINLHAKNIIRRPPLHLP